MDPGDVIAANVRRLARLERHQPAARLPDGRWRVPSNLVAQLKARETTHPRFRVHVEQVAPGLDAQVKTRGPVWLDSTEPPAFYGFGAEVARASAQRNQYLHDLGIEGSANNTTCALDGDNVRCWGNNAYGTAGVNVATNPIASPTLVLNQTGAALSGVTDVKPGTTVFSVLRNVSSLWNCGYGLNRYASNYGLTNILAIAYGGGYGADGPRFLTSDGLYHNGQVTLPVNCGTLQ